MGIIVSQIAVGGYDKNFSYVLYDEVTKNAAIVDPCGDLEAILNEVEAHELDVVGVLLTHTHKDHIDKLDELLRQYAIPVHVQTAGVANIFSQSPIYPMRDRETLVLGDSQIMALYTPGHTQDSVCFVIDTANAADDIPKVITGDTLFVGGCGRVAKDDVQYLYNSLIRLKGLPAESEIYPGHDYGQTPTSTLEVEKATNPYLLTSDFEAFKKMRLS